MKLQEGPVRQLNGAKGNNGDVDESEGNDEDVEKVES